MFQLLSFFSFLAITLGATLPTDKPCNIQELIVGGKNTSISEVPYQVALITEFGLLCGGSIISSKYILTAAHCIIDGMNISVRAGSSLTSEGGVVIVPKKAMRHSRYIQKGKDYDVGLIELSTPLKFTKNIQPIKLARRPPPDDKYAKVSGWGCLKFGEQASKWLQSVNVPIVNKKKCAQEYVGMEIITPRMICAGEQGKDSCQGDSGGPLVYKGQQVGIVSFGEGCGLRNFAGIYTNIADRDIRAFIQQYVPID